MADRKIVLASQKRVSKMGAEVEEFLNTIFGIQDGALVTDESKLQDFDSSDNSIDRAWAKIEDTYGVSREQVNSNYIVDVVEACWLRLGLD